MESKASIIVEIYKKGCKLTGLPYCSDDALDVIRLYNALEHENYNMELLNSLLINRTPIIKKDNVLLIVIPPIDKCKVL